MRLTRSKLDYITRAQLPTDIKPHGVGNTSIIYLYPDRAEVYTTEYAKCLWLEHIGIINGCSYIGTATYEGYKYTGCEWKFKRNTVDVYHYRAPRWQQPQGAQLTEARRLTRKIRQAMWSVNTWGRPENERIPLMWEAIENANIHPDVNTAADYTNLHDGLYPDAGLNDWAVINGELRWVDPFHDADLGKNTIQLRKNCPHRY